MHFRLASWALGRCVRPIRWLLDTIANIWFGVSMLVLIFLYSSLGSAAPPIRQGVLADWWGLEFLRFEKSEMAWFGWWPFQVLIGLFCLAMVVMTVRRIRLKVINLGVWTIHTGIIILAISSAVYFGSKVEGDVAIFQSKAYLLAPGMSEPVTLVVRPGAATWVGQGPDRYHLRVMRMNPDYVLQSRGYEGERTQAIWFAVQSFAPRRNFIRVVIVGHPEFTEDVVIGADGPQRVRKVFGKPLLDENLQIKLWYDPVDKFYRAGTAAVYARFSPEQAWTQLRLEGLPRYFEYISQPEGLMLSAEERSPPLRPLDLEPEIPAEAGAMAALHFRVTDYLPYANLRSPPTQEGRPKAAERARIVPRYQRESLARVGQRMSLIRVEVRDGPAVRRVWLPFSQYAFDDAQRAQPSRFRFAPRRVPLADGRTLELLYSRWRDPLPAPIALDRFILKTHPGGDQPSDYISHLAFYENGQWSKQLYEVKSNHPKQHGQWWYFQSQWDPGTEAYTVLGVGNRRAVHVMLGGVIVSITGMIYAFYVKPTLIRRRKRAGQIQRASNVQTSTPTAQPSPARVPEVTHV